MLCPHVVTTVTAEVGLWVRNDRYTLALCCLLTKAFLMGSWCCLDKRTFDRVDLMMALERNAARRSVPSE